jgi:hypothetical protein
MVPNLKSQGENWNVDFFPASMRHVAELWICNNHKQLLCGFKNNGSLWDASALRWQACFSRVVGERESYLDSCLQLCHKILKLKFNPHELFELHFRFNATGEVLTKVFVLKLHSNTNFPSVFTSGFSKFEWKDLRAVELGIKNWEFSHSMDYRVADFLKNF